jgi:hypothetical protein
VTHTMIMKAKRGSLVGAIVYQPTVPPRAGKIVRDTAPMCARHRLVIVRWADSKEEQQIDSKLLNDLESLIEDQERELATHRKSLEQAKAV